ncbi:MAG: PAS domain S-box protein [Verrucomicrobiales bacterium]|nr:PAS domain S-box protein [Verrucomicrobiales bacterium]
MPETHQSDPRVLATDLHVEATYRLTEALVESEKRMRRRIELLNEVVFETDATGALVFLNEAWRRALGRSPEECLGQCLSEFVLTDDLPLLSAAFRGGGESAPGLRPSLRMRRADSGIAWMELSASPLADGGVVGALRDVTRERSARQEIAKLSLVASCTDNLVIITDREGRTEWVNQAFVRRTGYTLEEMQGRKPGHLLQGPETSRTEVERVRAAIDLGESVQAELLNYTRQGEPYWVSFQISPIRDAQGHVERFVSVQTDSTSLRQAQRELEAAKAAAERMASEAHAANQAKSEFLATMSHEIRTPLNGILGLNELLLQTPLGPFQRELADGVARSGESLLRILGDILDFSKIEAGQIALAEEPFHVRAVVEDVVNGISGSGHGKSVTLSAEVEGTVPDRLRGDPGRLRQVLQNLVGNGLKFTEAGSVEARVRVLESDESWARLRFEIVDTGMGIPATKLPLLFQRFQQLDSSTSRQFGGTGLGLAIARRLVEIMGGRIGVESEEGVGSLFWFELVLPVVAPVDVARLEGLRVLLAQDHAIHRKLSLLGLEKAGCRADSVGSGQEVLERLRSGSYDAVLIDTQLSDMDGSRLTAAIRDLPSPAGSPGRLRPRLVALMDRHGRESTWTPAAEGFDAALGLPFTRAELGCALLEVTRTVGAGTRPSGRT